MANQSHYEINVSHKGRHLFATAERSAVDQNTARMLFNIFLLRFPASEGFEVTCTYWESCGHPIVF